MSKRLLASFSGGETSALMTYLLLTEWRDRYDDIVVVFANTGEENEQTLEFVDRCDNHFGLSTVWVEATPDGGYRTVSFATASRRGEPYEHVIARYGIPNASFPHCTRELKTRPITKYLRSIGWDAGSYTTAIGIRADEARRMDKAAAAKQFVYPLAQWRPTTKPQVNAWWLAQPFRLELTGYQGNCKWCWKKTTRKLLTIMDETPEAFDFPERMERLYPRVGPEFRKAVPPAYPVRTFFRKHMTVADLRALHATGDWARAEDDAALYDSGDGCVESCEVDFGELL